MPRATLRASSAAASIHSDNQGAHCQKSCPLGLTRPPGDPARLAVQVMPPMDLQVGAIGAGDAGQAEDL